ncbi:hypothetical protein vseg_001848 [Gypsophila vaccaria]
MARRKNVQSLGYYYGTYVAATYFFGGKVIVFGGDFRPILHVVPRKSNSEVNEVSLVAFSFWPLFIKFRLSENIRAHEDLEFSAFILALGNGELQIETMEQSNYWRSLFDFMRIINCIH